MTLIDESDKHKAKGPLICIGGLLRCCHETFVKAVHEGTLPPDRLKCQYHDSWMRKGEDGIWLWDREAEK